MNIDKFAEFVLRETGNEALTSEIKNLGDRYLKRNVPQVEVGQRVWIISGYQKHFIIKGQITRVQFKKKYSFAVHYDGRETGASYSKNSIGKTVFFTEEEALKALEEIKNAKNG